MSAAKNSRLKERFGRIPRRILKSAEFQSLPLSARYLLLCLAAQYMGANNGHLTFTKDDGRAYGIGHARTRSHALRDLAHAGFIVRTLKGGLKPYGATRWALAWEPVHYSNGQRLDGYRPAPESSRNHIYGYHQGPPTSAVEVPVKPSDEYLRGTTVSRLTSTSQVLHLESGSRRPVKASA